MHNSCSIILLSLIKTSILLVLVTSLCNCQPNDAPSFEERINILKDYKNIDEHSFFEAFPADFKMMDRLFGYNLGTNKESIFYEEGEDMIVKFSSLKEIKDDVYFKKYIKICIDGKWKGDNIGYGFGLDNHLISNTKNVIRALNEFSKEEIKSVLYFLFDGPHPSQHVERFNELNRVLLMHDKNLARILMQSYTELKEKENTFSH